MAEDLITTSPEGGSENVGHSGAEQASEKVIEVGDAVRRIEKGLESAERIDETLTKTKKDQGKRQKKEEKSRKKAIKKNDEEDQRVTQGQAAKSMTYFANGVSKVSHLIRKNLKEAAIALKDLRIDYRLEMDRKKKKNG